MQPLVLPSFSASSSAAATGRDPAAFSFQNSPHDPNAEVVISAAVCEARLIFAAAFFVAHGAPRPTWSTATATGLTLFSWIRALLAHGSVLLQSRWRWSPEQAQLLYANLSLVVAPPPWSTLPGPSLLFCRLCGFDCMELSPPTIPCHFVLVPAHPSHWGALATRPAFFRRPPSGTFFRRRPRLRHARAAERRARPMRTSGFARRP
jgi:hypothetical protein